MEGLTVQEILDIIAKLTVVSLAFVLLVMLINIFRRQIEVQATIAKSNEATATANAAAATVTAGSLALMSTAVDHIDKRVFDFGIADKSRSDQLSTDIADVPEQTHKLVKPDITSVETAVAASKDEVLAKLVVIAEKTLEILVGQKSEKEERDLKETALAALASAKQAIQAANDTEATRTAAMTKAVQAAVDKALPPALPSTGG